MAFLLLSALVGAAMALVITWLVDQTTHQRSTYGERLLVIVIAALVLAGLAMKLKQPEPRWLIYGGLILVLIGVTLFDIRTHLIPHAVTIPGTVAGLIAGSYLLPLGILESLLGLGIGGGVLLTATLFEKIRKKEIGGGDWKYAAMIGSFIGPERIIFALIMTGIFGAIGAVTLAVLGRQAQRHALGPWLSAGAVASILLK